MIDFHCHLLPDLDDGATTIDDSIAMAKLLADFGYTTVCCTPHCIKGYYDLTPQKIREATLMLQADLDNADVALELRPGMEYMLDECFAEFTDDLLPLGDTKLILCEAPQQAHSEVVQEGLELIIKKGFVPLIAHPERTEHFYGILSKRAARGESQEKELEIGSDEKSGTRDMENLQKPNSFLKKLWPFAPRATRHVPLPHKVIPDLALPETCLFQANLGSFTGYYGETVQRRAYELLKQGIYTALASDLHDGSSASKVLVYSKFETNPLLEKLAGWNGHTQMPVVSEKSEAGDQIGLF